MKAYRFEFLLDDFITYDELNEWIRNMSKAIKFGEIVKRSSMKEIDAEDFKARFDKEWKEEEAIRNSV